MNNQYLDIFLEESKEHIQNLNSNLLELESNPGQDIIDEIFRSAHTLKGMSGTMGFNRISEITHEMESLLQDIKDGTISVSPEVIDTLLESVDFLEKLIGDITENGEERDRDTKVILEKLRRKPGNATPLKESEKENKKPEENHIFNEFEERLMKEAIAKGLLVWEVLIKLDANCLLKSARAFLVFKTLESFGDIIKTKPIVQDIEDEKFDDEFTVYIISTHQKQDLEKALGSISELKSILIKEVEQSSLEKDPGNSEESPKETVACTLDEQSVRHASHVKKTSKTLRVDIDRLDNLMNLVSELIIIKTRLDGMDEKTEGQKRREAVEYLERITSSLHDAVMKVRMVPIENVFNRFPRVVRDLARELSKNITLIIEGAETELDRTVIDEIGDPLIHLIRNSADHGIEIPEERFRKGKPAQGTIKLKAYHDGNNVVIEISDDGRGINLNNVLKTAIDKGLVDRERAKNLKESEIISFLFEPGFSTKDMVTDISGRGVGLDVVKTKIESLGGGIEINTVPDQGTTFLIRLPLTLAIIQALMVMVGEEKYAIPLSAIKETVIVASKDIKKVQKNEVTLLRGNVIPILRLGEMLDVESNGSSEEDLTVVIVKKGERDIGLVVDSLIGQQEIVIKSLGNFLKNIKFIAGATILGDGKVALILDVNTMF
ncbi:chemotaxis protein CheA [Biomaibacter acetigenes]|uniref:Chemotaxis protein CheA n=1 Tax=Biomaibacter acetigenes TaxID=2316383 RepID=A0A3G2R6L8_9FIRM|nr:chemotaxis protein CheA [Biomaibacter acetigenes]AYO30487.1 chemotaxis protein CheA [Biomaibacter acetigenes]